MMPAAKHGDPQMGVDIHLCVVPPSPSPVPLPTPHMSVVFDPFDYLPIIGATVTVCGMKRAVAGTAGKAVHIPPGFPFAPKIPDTEDELFMGSATVVADGDPFSFLTVPVLACQVAGMPSPPRPKRKGKRLMLLPTVVNMAIPTTVFVGGPPTISMMGMAFKLGFAALGRLAKSRVRQGAGPALQRLAQGEVRPSGLGVPEVHDPTCGTGQYRDGCRLGGAGRLHSARADSRTLEPSLCLRQRAARRLRHGMGMPSRCPAGARRRERHRAVPPPGGRNRHLPRDAGTGETTPRQCRS